MSMSINFYFTRCTSPNFPLPNIRNFLNSLILECWKSEFAVGLWHFVEFVSRNLGTSVFNSFRVDIFLSIFLKLCLWSVDLRSPSRTDCSILDLGTNNCLVDMGVCMKLNLFLYSLNRSAFLGSSAYKCFSRHWRGIYLSVR